MTPLDSHQHLCAGLPVLEACQDADVDTKGKVFAPMTSFFTQVYVLRCREVGVHKPARMLLGLHLKVGLHKPASVLLGSKVMITKLRKHWHLVSMLNLTD